tara:strand:+ start:271 stop:453 length:183 start_codon:yes stop_codon:yes gene_type:complete
MQVAVVEEEIQEILVVLQRTVEEQVVVLMQTAVMGMIILVEVAVALVEQVEIMEVVAVRV